MICILLIYFGVVSVFVLFAVKCEDFRTEDDMFYWIDKIDNHVMKTVSWSLTVIMLYAIYAIALPIMVIIAIVVLCNNKKKESNI